MLSDAVFARIASYLDFWTVFQFCLLDDKFCRIIGENIVARDGLDIGRISDQVDCRHTLRYLGEYATKLYISISDFKLKDPNVSFSTEMFRHIGRFCTNLKTLYVILVGSSFLNFDFKMTNWSGFKNIETLRIKVNVGYQRFNINIDSLLTKIIPKCENLNSLTIHNMCTAFEYLLFPLCQRGLQSLCIRNCLINSRQNMMQIMHQHKRTLETFHFNFSKVLDYHFINVLDNAVNAMPKLTAVCAYPIWNFYEESVNIVSTCNLLLQFKNLSSIGFQLNKKSIHMLKVLADRNEVQTVTMHFSDVDFNLTTETLERLTRYTNLKCIRFVRNFSYEFRTIRQILNALPGLVECHFCDIYSFDLKILNMIRSPLLQRIVFENTEIRIFKCSFNQLNEQRAFICPNAPSLEIHVDAVMLNRAKTKLGKLNGSHVHFCLLERFECYN